ncbi:hypothetical protein [Ensifer sp. BR816]|uniref:hypothetical protein n=1 Tax=Rhizobium sp. (strain BR816) TaxID=1057002 RepID=UPI0003646CF7|nr:hypothetical protein [Ensifer sp. BR816]
MRRCFLLFALFGATTVAFASEGEDFGIAVEAMRRRSQCTSGSGCEPSTGCTIPPPGLVEPGQVASAQQSQRRPTPHDTFHACREMVLRFQSTEATIRDLVARLWPFGRTDGFAEALEAWNRELLWAPAAATEAPITKFGDELRAVFGPVPAGDCLAEGSRRLSLEVDGNLVELRRNPANSNALQFEHVDASGRHVKWTDQVDRCDKPSLAGMVTYCGMNSRLSRVARGPVEWLFLCRKSSKNLELSSDPYWQEWDPRFALYGAIGFNELTGEIAFIDGRKDRETFDWRETFPPPGGQSYADAAGRSRTEDMYDKSFRVDCFACHDNKEPYVIGPHVKQARVGYLRGNKDERSTAFGLGTFLPQRKGRAEAPFRVIGSSYTAARRARMTQAKVVSLPGHPCTSCHVLTTQETGQRFAADAAGKKPTAILSPERALPLLGQREFLAAVGEHRTVWATRGGEGKIHPWMLPHYGGDLSEQSPEVTDDEWQALSQCLWDAGGAECGYRPLYTACPSPGRTGDGYVPQDLATEIVALSAPRDGFKHAIRLSWTYLNGYGQVPERDDVRFNIAIKTEAISQTTAPRSDDFPTMAEARGDRLATIVGKVGFSGSTSLVQDASFVGHRKWTEPLPASAPRRYSIEIPAACGKRYLFRILPKRFCFDYNGIAFGTEDHVIHTDVTCAPASANLR